METKFAIRFVGTSQDARTNIWKARCLECGKEHQPPTTMLATQKIECPNKKCGAIEVVDYNEIQDGMDNKKNNNG